MQATKETLNGKNLKALQEALWPYRYLVLYYLLRPKHLVKLVGRRIFLVRGRRQP